MAGVQGAHDATTQSCSGTTYTSACQTGAAIGTGIGITMLLGIWFVGFIVLSLIWLMSRPVKRMCPQCGYEVKKGLTACIKCKYSFTPQNSPEIVASTISVATPHVQPATPHVQPAFRGQCGTVNQAGTAFCGRCGTAMSTSVFQTVQGR